MTKFDPDRPHCRFCGAMLREQYAEEIIVHEYVVPKLSWRKEGKGWVAESLDDDSVKHCVQAKRGTLKGYGYQAEGLFCSTKCGYRWALARLRGENLEAAEVKKEIGKK